MPKVKKIHLHVDDLHKLKKYKVLRIDNYVIDVDEIAIPQIKIYGKIKI